MTDFAVERSYGRLSSPVFMEAARVLLRRRGLIIMTSGLIMAGAVAVVTNLPDHYTAEAIILLSNRDTKLAQLQSTSDKMIAGLQSDAAVIRTQMDIIQAPAMVAQVVKDLGLADKPGYGIKDPKPLPEFLRGPERMARAWIAGPEVASWAEGVGLSRWLPRPDTAKPDADPNKSAATAAARQVAKKLTLLNEGGSYAIKIRYQGTSANEAAAVANTFATLYLEQRNDLRSRGNETALSWLNTRLTELRELVVAKEQALGAFREQHNLFQTEGMTLLDRRIVETNSALVEAASQVRAAEAALQQARGAAGDSNRAILNSPVVQNLRRQEAELKAREADLLTAKGDANPEVAKARAQLREIRDNLSRETARLSGSFAQDVAVARQREATTRATLAALQQERAALTGAERQAQEMERELAAFRTSYSNLLQKSAELAAGEKDQLQDAVLISGAEPPPEPSGPNRALLLAAALMTAMSFAVLLALLAHRLRHGISNLDTFGANGIRPLGTVPEMPRGLFAVDAIVRSPGSLFPEAIHSIVAALQGSAAGHDSCKVLLVTSSVPQEGKTVLATSLARALALSGKRVLLLDFDWRQPSVGRLLGAPLTHVVPDGSLGAMLPDIYENGVHGGGAPVLRDEMSTLDFVPAGVVHGDVPSKLSSVETRRLLDRARAQYDVVVIDSAPLLAVSDAAILSQLVDGVLMVVRWERTPRAVVQNALAALRQANAPLLGAVLTRVNVRKHARYRYGDMAYVQSKHSHYYLR
ncbi:GumC family protein [Azospirillum soli]|uniref:GumC family protein n=1 Tax=Azospirillum soli TaxID=1304799 RepID=UPI001AEB17F3|nr:AAA family ATPase [Azospirillum soli]MBP2312549.1 capsular exopolysaccharide synthesis family protein [Azospirillum soli]